MIRTDRMHEWAPTLMHPLEDRRYPRMFAHPAAAVAEPGAVLDDEQIEAAHAATDIGSDDDKPTRRVPWTAFHLHRVLVGGVFTLLAIVGAVHLLGRVWAWVVA